MNKLIVLAFVLIFGAGCANDHLVYIHESSLGVNLAPANPQSGTSKMSVGFDRETYAIVPKKENDKDVMSLLAVSRVWANGLYDIKFGHVVATGNAAKNVAENPELIKQAKKSLLDEQKKPEGSK